MRTWIKLALVVLLLPPLTPAAFGADPETNTAQQIKQLQADVDALRGNVAKLKNDMIDTNLKINTIAGHLDEIKDVLHRIERMATAQPTTRYYGPSTAGVMPSATPSTTGTIALRNHYAANATVSINGRPYRVLAGQDLPIAGVPVGPVNIEVSVDGYGVVQGLRTETLRANGRIITIFPQFGG